MPVTYSIDPHARLIHTTCTGNLTLEEVISHFQELKRDPNCPSRLDVLLDLSEVTSLPETGQLGIVAVELRQTFEKVRFDVCAIVARTDALFGMLRIFEVMVERYFRAIQVFRVRAEAESWLVAQKMPAG
jgi:hypothetical protein